MSKSIYCYTLFIINYLLANQKLCGSNEIEHCIECDNDQEICKNVKINILFYLLVQYALVAMIKIMDNQHVKEIVTALVIMIFIMFYVINAKKDIIV